MTVERALVVVVVVVAGALNHNIVYVSSSLLVFYDTYGFAQGARAVVASQSTEPCPIN